MSVNMGNVLGLIFANMHDKTCDDLTKSRTMGSVLFGGRYRLIDFPISNMANSGVSEVGVITKSNYQSLLDHLGSAREWDLSRKKGGLHILPPFGHVGSGLYRGRLEAMYGAMSFIKSSQADYVILSDCDIIANIDYKPIVQAHIDTGADITVVCQKGNYSSEEIAASTVLAVNDQNKVYDVLIAPNLSGTCIISMNMFVMKKDFLLDMLQIAMARSEYSFERDLLQAKCKELNIIAYEYENFMRKIYSMKSYYETNMELLTPEITRKLFHTRRPIYTKVRDNPPAKYGIDCKVTNSLIADGCIIEGEVENSILFRGVKVGKGAKIKNSILMQDTTVGDKSEINYIITDKNVNISNFRLLTGSESYPLYVGKGASI